MKQLKTQLVMALSIMLCLTLACSSDDTPEPVIISISDINLTITENPDQGQLLGTAAATASHGDIVFSLSSQSPSGALAIDATSGTLTVANTALFDFEANPTITAEATATAAGESQSATITITLTDVDESTLDAQNFTVTIDENPSQDQSLGSITANSTGAAPSFTITSQSPTDAIDLDSNTGELTVANTTLFNFETNPTLTANIQVSSGSNTVNITATITLNDVDENLPNAFTTTWQTTAANESITIPVNEDFSGYDYTIDWGDGTRLMNQTSTISHIYTSSGTYTIQISGDFPAIKLGTSGMSQNSEKIQTIEQWGNIAWQSMELAFQGAENMIYNATDAPDLSAVTSMGAMFSSAKNFNGDLSTWDVSNVEDMNSLFVFAEKFNGNLSTWNTEKVTKMNSMFSFATIFNQPIGAWDVGMVNDFSGMFNKAESFNQSLNNWNVSSATAMRSMFFSSNAFDQDLNSWDVSKVTDFNRMFFSANVFNGDISNWDMSSATNLTRMFAAAIVFNQDISNWDVSSVTTFSGMFINAYDFNQNIGNWNTGSATDFSEMFRSARSFNSNLNRWNTSNVTNMAQMFSGAIAYNQPMNSWNVENVQQMEFLFFNATAFSNNIRDWNIINVTNMQNMLDSTNISRSVYDTMLLKWATLNVQNNVTLGAAGLNYSSTADNARQKLIDDFGWQFVGDSEN